MAKVTVTGFTAGRMLGIENDLRRDMKDIQSHTADSLRLAALFAGLQSGIVNPGALTPWRTALTNPGVAKLAIVGDSISDGGLASSWIKTYPWQLQARLRTLTGTSGGMGYVPATHSTQGAIVPPVPNTRVGMDRMWEHGLGGRAMFLSEENDHVTYDPRGCVKIRVWYGKTSVGGGGLRVLIDDVDQGVLLSGVETGGASYSGGHIWESGPLSTSGHTVKIVPSNPPYVGILEGVEFIDTDLNNGVRVYNAAHSGGSVSAFNQPAMALHWQSVAAIGADLVLVNLGTNDITGTVSSFLSGMDTMLSKIPSSTPVLLVGNYLRGDYQTEAGRAKWKQMQDGLEARAQGRVAYLDISPHWPQLVANGSTSDGLMFDTPPIHPNDAGMERMAEILATALGHSADNSFKGPRGVQGPQGPSTPAGVSYGTLTLSAGSPVVPELKNVNEWTISGNVQVQLPVVADGSQFTVLVKSGFQGLTWPNGTQVLGTTSQTANVVVTLARLAGGWTVLVSSPSLAGGSGTGLDTGWVAHIAGVPGMGIVAGNAADLYAGWGLGAHEIMMIQLRRIGNILYVSMAGLTKTATSTGVGMEMMFKLPAGLYTSGAAVSAQVPYHLAGANYPLPSGLLSVAVTGNAEVTGYTLDLANPKLPVGATIGRSGGSNLYGSTFSMPIMPSSIWGT